MFHTANLHSYGFLSNTHIKFLLMLRQTDEPLVDADVQIVFSAIQKAYIAHICNPFTDARDLPSGLGSVAEGPSAPTNMDGDPPIISTYFDQRSDSMAGWRHA